MRAILVIGSINEDKKEESFKRFCYSIGKKTVEMGYMLINGGSAKELHADQYAAKGALDACKAKNYNPEDYLLGIVGKDVPPHSIGPLIHVKGTTVNEKYMSLIQKASAIMVVGGGGTTSEYLVLADLTKKPIIPIPHFPGCGYDYWEKYANTVPVYFPESITMKDIENINKVIGSNEDKDISNITDTVLSLAKKSFTESNHIFVAIPFKDKYNNVFKAIKLAVEKVNETLVDINLDCGTIKDVEETKRRIDEEIEDKIKKAKIVITDVSEQNPNVYYEFGFARGQKVCTIPIAAERSELPFDTRALKTEFYCLENPDTLDNDREEFANNLARCILAGINR